MGISFSITSRRRTNPTYYPHPTHPPHHHHHYPTTNALPDYYYPPYPAHVPAYPAQAPPLYCPHPHAGDCNAYSYANPFVGQPSFGHFHNQNGWQPPMPQAMPPLPPPYTEQNQAKKVQSLVNVHKDTLSLEVDEMNPDHHLVSFVFDALLDGSFTIYYFAKEEPNCVVATIFPEVCVPVKIPFCKGLHQKFHQPSGTGIDLGFFVFEDLSNPSQGENVFPLVICAEAYYPSLDASDNPLAYRVPHMQITQAILEKDHGVYFNVKVIKQLLWANGIRYELRDIYGIRRLVHGANESEPGQECVICMTEAKDTAVLPCRHMCMCSYCAKELRLQSNKCPLCREVIEELLEIRISNVDQ